ncbi:MAG TPA: helix-turn-helix transcriptional regulator [Candidatus Nitrosocosmicus sp.]|nr:helix-turn-helix transcriptional regulator [Candidatus Nitrosocosmicus sp.]
MNIEYEKNKRLRSEFAQRLRRLREAREMSQLDLAKLLRVTGGVISSWEVERQFPSIANAIELGKIFGCSLDYLFTGGEYDEREV